jgi:hypothetical protein
MFHVNSWSFMISWTVQSQRGLKQYSLPPPPHPLWECFLPFEGVQMQKCTRRRNVHDTERYKMQSALTQRSRDAPEEYSMYEFVQDTGHLVILQSCVLLWRNLSLSFLYKIFILGFTHCSNFLKIPVHIPKSFYWCGLLCAWQKYSDPAGLFKSLVWIQREQEYASV